MEISKIPNKLHENTVTAKLIAEEGTVLLKNDNGVLPLKATDVVGGFLGTIKDLVPTFLNNDIKKDQDLSKGITIFGGSGSGWVNSIGNISYHKGLQKIADKGFIKDYFLMNQFNESKFDKVIYYITRFSDENSDQKIGLDGNGGNTGYYLNNDEKNELLSLIEKIGKQKIIVVLNVGTVMDTTWLIEQDIAAIVLAYYGGEQAGNALANILTGNVNPSGKTVNTWAKHHTDYLSSETFGSDKYTEYIEDIFVGYRYFSTFDTTYKRVNYPFGFGLSYTNFEMSNIKLEVNDSKIMIQTKVKNIGNISGKEVVQLYYSAPQGKLGKPSKELIGFKKTKLLKPNESQIIEISFDIHNMASFDDTGKIKNYSWVLEEGDYNFYVGNSIKDADGRGKIGLYHQAINEVVREVSPVSTSVHKRLLSNGSYEILNKMSLQNKHVVPKCGSLYVQAEDYVTSSKDIRSDSYYVGLTRGFKVTNLNNQGQFLEYNLKVEATGEYYIAFNMELELEENTTAFEITVDGVKQEVFKDLNDDHENRDKCTGKIKYFTSTSYKVNFPKIGDVKLRVTSLGKQLVSFDSFIIFNKDVSDEGVTKIEAETFDESNGDSVFTVAGAATMPNQVENSQYTYDLRVKKSGDYDLRLMVSNTKKAQKGAMLVYVNGIQNAKVDVKRTAIDGSGAFKDNHCTYQETDSVKVNLPEGHVKIKIETVDNTVSSIDYFTLRPYDKSKLLKGQFRDNTDEFNYHRVLNGHKLDKLITFPDIVKNHKLLDPFVSQLSIVDLARLAGLYKENSRIMTGVGGIGGFYVDEKYQIPNAYTADGPAGIRYVDDQLYSTWFPNMTLLASTWNHDLAYLYGQSVAAEAKLGGVHIWLAPGINIHRNPLNGRNFEYFSEDPYLTGVIGALITKGSEELGVSVCVKHYAANNQERNRYGNSSQVSHRALREIYFKAFEYIIKEGKPGTIMTSYNLINDEYVAGSYNLITEVLKNDFGFEGVVFSDWDAHASHTEMMLAGNNIKSSNPNYEELVSAYQNGIISREILEKNAKIVIEFLIKKDMKNN